MNAAAAPTTGVLRRALAAATVLGLAACRGEPPTEPRAPYPYDIVFERREGAAGAPDLYHLDLETDEATRILAPGVGGEQPSSAPTGAQVAFVRTDTEFTSEIFIGAWSASTGQLSGLTNLSNYAGADVMPALSPDGQRIAFVTDRAGFQDIFVVNVNGTGLRRITPQDPPSVVTTEWWPAWSRDGQLLAYSSTIEGTPDIWTTTVDATTVMRTLRTSGPHADYHPTWSPDGTRIAFHRIDANTGEADIVILTLGTLTLQPVRLPGQQLWPAWSPEGDLIAFSSNHEDVGGDLEIYTMRVDGTGAVRRTTNGVNDLRPTWLVRPVQ